MELAKIYNLMCYCEIHLFASILWLDCHWLY